tara:strand:- start:297 stop:644 length:348 start_codon:yes stop_codon:yes gene_type:complete
MAIKATGEEALALLLLHAKIPFQREYKFHMARKWRFDFVIGHQPLSAKIAIEIEGGIFSQGRHTRGTGFSKDCEKYNMAVLQGWSILRYPTQMVSMNVLDDIRMLQARIKYVRTR